ncbi:hypothetical protein [Paeniglutamicibacter cryotolerans]|uniref:Uncharacterized protein n=1 Tax=Paeniglutamicibacter cryotolerans TaxID=670079 RepID=A0A839QLA4_9MICC|nr:hypothetical protein [Paeniglutamicibacter cryotolerans]MBB2996393.1 hypothetical protein [Paeniglutamicibacter cryotolerans]
MSINFPALKDPAASNRKKALAAAQGLAKAERENFDSHPRGISIGPVVIRCPTHLG